MTKGELLKRAIEAKGVPVESTYYVDTFGYMDGGWFAVVPDPAGGSLHVYLGRKYDQAAKAIKDNTTEPPLISTNN